MRRCDRCKAEMAPMRPRKRIGEELWCQTCVKKPGAPGRYEPGTDIAKSASTPDWISTQAGRYPYSSDPEARDVHKTTWEVTVTHPKDQVPGQRIRGRKLVLCPGHIDDLRSQAEPEGYSVKTDTWPTGAGNTPLVHDPCSACTIKAVNDIFKQASAPEGHETLYHITDRHQFAPDAEHAPQDNAFAIQDRSGRGGLYVTDDPDRWRAHGYHRPYVAEIHVPHGVAREERWHGEKFIPAEHFDKIHVNRVIPFDQHQQERWGGTGSIEDYHGTPTEHGDARQFTPEQNGEHMRRMREYLHNVQGFGWNEFNDAHEYVGVGDHDVDREGEAIRRDRDGKVMTRGRYASKTAASPDWFTSTAPFTPLPPTHGPEEASDDAKMKHHLWEDHGAKHYDMSPDRDPQTAMQWMSNDDLLETHEHVHAVPGLDEEENPHEHEVRDFVPPTHLLPSLNSRTTFDAFLSGLGQGPTEDGRYFYDPMAEDNEYHHGDNPALNGHVNQVLNVSSRGTVLGHEVVRDGSLPGMTNVTCKNCGEGANVFHDNTVVGGIHKRPCEFSKVQSPLDQQGDYKTRNWPQGRDFDRTTVRPMTADDYLPPSLNSKSKDTPVSPSETEDPSRYDGVSIKKDDEGYYVHTHRARSKSYPSPEAIPTSKIEFIESTGSRQAAMEIHTCRNCGQRVRESNDPNVPWVHHGSGNSYCDVTDLDFRGPEQAVNLSAFNPTEMRTEAEPEHRFTFDAFLRTAVWDGANHSLQPGTHYHLPFFNGQDGTGTYSHDAGPGKHVFHDEDGDAWEFRSNHFRHEPTPLHPQSAIRETPGTTRSVGESSGEIPNHDVLRTYPARLRDHLVEHHGEDRDEVNNWTHDTLHRTHADTHDLNPNQGHTHAGDPHAHLDNPFHDLAPHGLTRDHFHDVHHLDSTGLTAEQIVAMHRDDHDNGPYEAEVDLGWHGHPANQWPSGHVHHRFDNGEYHAPERGWVGNVRGPEVEHDGYDHARDRAELQYADQHPAHNPYGKEDDEGFVEWHGSGDSGGASFSPGEPQREGETFDAYMDRVINENSSQMSEPHIDGDYYGGDHDTQHPVRHDPARSTNGAARPSDHQRSHDFWEDMHNADYTGQGGHVAVVGDGDMYHPHCAPNEGTDPDTGEPVLPEGYSRLSGYDFDNGNADPEGEWCGKCHSSIIPPDPHERDRCRHGDCQGPHTDVNGAVDEHGNGYERPDETYHGPNSTQGAR